MGHDRGDGRVPCLPPETPLDDARIASLLVRVRQGDAVAVHEFYREVEPFLRALSRRFLSGRLRRHVDSVDIAQSVVRRALASSKTQQLRDETRVLGWLASIVRNRVRTLSRHLDGPGGSTYESLEGVEPATPVPDAATRAADVEEVHRLRLALETLDPDERSAVVLRDFEDLPFAEVARLLDRPSAEAARKLHTRAMSRLRARLERR